MKRRIDWATYNQLPGQVSNWLKTKENFQQSAIDSLICETLNTGKKTKPDKLALVAIIRWKTDEINSKSKLTRSQIRGK